MEYCGVSKAYAASYYEIKYWSETLVLSINTILVSNLCDARDTF